MAKAIPRIGSRRNGHSGSRTSARRYQRQLFMFKQVSIIPFLLLQMYGIGWFLGPPPVLVDSRVREEGHHLLLKSERNAIRTIVDQGLQRAEVMIKGPDLKRDVAL
ncbi:hypothetical protein M9H77_08240 [Catharanthus roseus]|uniref:Uncharacterized protein n=1 Tax=Catharanthus roseus TaxID=4058 RepID=A0ACC0BXB8_CATRO|nr:hypothetical protein M9H77_08240 [Catharanthus roseus]